MKFLTRVVAVALGSNARPSGTVVDTVVLHANAGATLKSSYDYLLGKLRNADPKDDASYHAGAERDGSRWKFVPLSRRAWHAGACYRGIGRDSKDLNGYSVGFCFASDDQTQAITEAQIESVVEWLLEVKAQLPLRYLTTHAGVAYPRKVDVLGTLLSDAQLQEIARRTGLLYVKGLRP